MQAAEFRFGQSRTAIDVCGRVETGRNLRARLSRRNWEDDLNCGKIFSLQSRFIKVDVYDFGQGRNARF
jgi:hypothetical protein